MTAEQTHSGRPSFTQIIRTVETLARYIHLQALSSQLLLIWTISQSWVGRCVMTPITPLPEACVELMLCQIHIKMPHEDTPQAKSVIAINRQPVTAVVSLLLRPSILLESPLQVRHELFEANIADVDEHGEAIEEGWRSTRTICTILCFL